MESKDAVEHEIATIQAEIRARWIRGGQWSLVPWASTCGFPGGGCKRLLQGRWIEHFFGLGVRYTWVVLVKDAPATTLPTPLMKWRLSKVA